MQRLFWSVLGLSFQVNAALGAGAFDCVVDLYLAAHDRGALLQVAAAHAQDFEDLSYLGTTRQDRSQGDLVLFEDLGVPSRLSVGFAKENQAFHYFSKHPFVSSHFEGAAALEGMLLAFQKIVAGPGVYVESQGESSGHQTTHLSISGVFLLSPREVYPRAFVERHGFPLKVELLEGTPLVHLETGVYLVPGPPSKLVVPVKARVLSEGEKAQLTKAPAFGGAPAPPYLR